MLLCSCASYYYSCMCNSGKHLRNENSILSLTHHHTHLHSLYIHSYAALLCPLSSWLSMCCPWRDVLHPPNSMIQTPSYLQPCQHGTGSVNAHSPPGETGASSSLRLSVWTVCVCVCVLQTHICRKTDQKPEDQMLSLPASGRGMIQFPISCDYVQMELALRSDFTLHDMVARLCLEKQLTTLKRSWAHYSHSWASPAIAFCWNSLSLISTHSGLTWQLLF